MSEPSVNTEYLAQLLEMGFPDNRARKALLKTGNAGSNEAMEWLFEHMEDADIDDPVEAQPAAVEAEVPAAEPQAQSLQCDQCGKVLRGMMDAQLHGEQTGHSQFSESAEPYVELTAEEKEEKMRELQDLVAKRRAERVEREKKEAVEAEKKRREAARGLQESREEFQQQQRMKAAEQRRREREADARHREEVKRRIEQDRRERQVARNPQAQAQPTAAPAPARTSTQCRIQVRQTDGAAQSHVFAPDDTIADVVAWIDANRTDGDRPYAVLGGFPPQEVARGAMAMTLRDAGYCPSGVFIMSPR